MEKKRKCVNLVQKHLMGGKSMKNKTGVLESGASDPGPGLHSVSRFMGGGLGFFCFFMELKTLGRKMYYLFKRHKAYICLLKYSNLFQDGKCLAEVNYGW